MVHFLYYALPAIRRLVDPPLEERFDFEPHAVIRDQLTVRVDVVLWVPFSSFRFGVQSGNIRRFDEAEYSIRYCLFFLIVGLVY